MERKERKERKKRKRKNVFYFIETKERYGAFCPNSKGEKRGNFSAAKIR